MNKQTTFSGGGGGGGSTPPIPTCSLCRKNISWKIFYNNPIMWFVLTFSMELQYTIYYLSPDPFCYVVSILLPYAEHEEACLSNWWKFLLLKDCAILV